MGTTWPLVTRKTHPTSTTTRHPHRSSIKFTACGHNETNGAHQQIHPLSKTVHSAILLHSVTNVCTGSLTFPLSISLLSTSSRQPAALLPLHHIAVSHYTRFHARTHNCKTHPRDATPQHSPLTQSTLHHASVHRPHTRYLPLSTLWQCPRHSHPGCR